MSSSIRLGNGGFTPSPLNPYTISGAMSVGDAVYLVPGSALTVARADANDAAKRPPIGIVAGISGSTAQVAGSGAVASGLVGLTVGSVYYLGTTPGSITTTVPASDIYILGVAISTSQILVGTVPKDLVGGGGGASSLQDAYDGGATITTAGVTNIAFTLASGSFTVEGDGFSNGDVLFGAALLDTIGQFQVRTAQLIRLATNDGGPIEIEASPGGSGAATVSITGDGGVTVDSANGPITIGSNNEGYAVNIGNTASTSSVVLQAGTGKINFDDVYQATSTGYTSQMPFSAATSEWDNFATKFGNGTSLLAAIVQAVSASYDFSGEVAGTPTVSSEVFHFKAARAFTLAASGHVAGCSAGPSASIQFDLQLNGVSIGDITFAGGTSGTVTIDSATTTAIVVNDIIKIVAPANLQGIDTPFWTFLGNT